MRKLNITVSITDYAGVRENLELPETCKVEVVVGKQLRFAWANGALISRERADELKREVEELLTWVSEI
jgi:hypothetical protein